MKLVNKTPDVLKHQIKDAITKAIENVDVSMTITTTQTKADKENGYILVQTQKNENKTYSDLYFMIF